MSDAALVVMARAPELGRVKTRLAAAVGDAAALAVYRQLLGRTHAVVREWPGPAVLEYAGKPEAFDGTGLECLPRREQQAGGLGRRIGIALRAGFDAADRVLVIGSDCPSLSRFDLLGLDRLLEEGPVAFGPAEDGGFWAIGARDPAVADTVQAADVPWSAPDTLATLRAALAERGFTSRLGAERFDVDDRDDLARAVAADLLTSPRNMSPDLP